MIRLAIVAALVLAAGAVLLLRVNDSEGVAQGFALILVLFAVVAIVIALVERWRRRAGR